MSVLSDRSILRHIATGKLHIDPFHQEQLQPSSYDVRLGNEFRVLQRTRHAMIDLRNIPEDLTAKYVVDEDEGFVIHPGILVLARTVERFRIGPTAVGRLEGKSSLGRLGLLIHITAGYFDPGFDGTGTLELVNVCGLPIKIYPNMLIGQMSFVQLDSVPLHLYGSPEVGSRYQGQEEPTASRFDLESR